MTLRIGAEVAPLHLQTPENRLANTVDSSIRGLGVGKSEASSPSPQSEFLSQVNDFLHNVDGQQKQAEHAASEFAEGRSNDIHGVMIAMQKADITLHLAGNIRNRLLEAYREIMRMGA